jgi:Fe2+ transport system protein B
VALNKVDAIPERELAKKRSSLEKACGHKVHIISGVTGEGINTVLRAMAREVNRRRTERAEAARYGRPAPVLRTRAERQAVNFNAPVVPASKSKPETTSAKASAKAPDKTVKTKVATPVKGPAKSPRKMDTPKAKAKKAAKKAVRKAAKPKKPATSGGKAKAKHKTGSRTAKRAKKKQRR